jgi:ATP-dependent helicase/nuclease subunit B
MPVILQHIAEGRTPTLRELLTGAHLDRGILVVPTKRRIRHLSREILTVATRGVSPALPLHTLESLALSIRAASPRARRLMGGTAQTLLFDNAIRLIGDDLHYFRLKGRDRRLFQGTFERVIDVVLHLKESGVSVDHLVEEADAAPLDERQKLLDVAAMYRAYDGQLSLLEAEDTAGLFRNLVAEHSQPEFQEIFRRVYPNVASLSLAGFDEFTPPEMGFIQKLIVIPGMAMSMLFDFQHGNRELFGHLEENYRTFLAFGFSETPSNPADRDKIFSLLPSARPADSQAAIDHLGSALFNSRLVTRRNCSSRITVGRARNRTHEIEVICKLILAMLSKAPERDLSTICVAMVRPQLYTDIVREQFKRFGIPVNVTDRFALRRSPVATAMLAPLEIQVNGFRRDDVLRAVSNPFLRWAGDSGPVDAANLTDVSRRLRILGGFRSWLSRIDAAIQRTDQGFSTSDSAPGRERSERVRRSLEQAKTDIQAIRRIVSLGNDTLTPDQFHRQMRHLFQALGIGEGILRREEPADAGLRERDVRAYAKVLAVLEETVNLLAVREGTDTRHTLAYYMDHLTLALGQERYNVREQFGQGVLVTSIDETRGLSMDVMIIAGLVDGEFPSMYEPEVFMSARRQKIREQHHDWQNRYLFYQAATNWSDHLYVTSPARDGDLDLVLSPFVDSLLAVAEVERWEEPSSYPLAEALCSEDEVLTWYTRSGGNIPDSSMSWYSSFSNSLREVRRVAAIEQSRLEHHRLPDYEGILEVSSSPRIRSLFHEMASRMLSVSQLETYADCPFRFFAERLLRLNTAEEFREDLTPLEKGDIIHESLFEFSIERRQLGLPPLAQCADSVFHDAALRLTEIVRGKLDALDIPDAFWDVEKELLLGSQGSGGVLRQFLTKERERAVASVPAYFEVSFGDRESVGDKRDPLLSTSEPIHFGSMQFRGKIDRVDVGPGFFSIIDYKTGRTMPTLDDIRRGYSLQLPVYLHAVRELFRQGGNELAAAGALYYSVRDPVSIRVVIGDAEFKGPAFEPGPGTRYLVANAAELQGLIDGSREAAERYRAGIDAGRFPLTPPERIPDVCTYCPFKSMCRIQTVRRVRPQDPDSP